MGTTEPRQVSDIDRDIETALRPCEMTSLTPLPAVRLSSETLLGVLQKPHFRWRNSPQAA
jgi:hypothetical protein